MFSGLLVPPFPSVLPLFSSFSFYFSSLFFLAEKKYERETRSFSSRLLEKTRKDLEVGSGMVGKLGKGRREKGKREKGEAKKRKGRWERDIGSPKCFPSSPFFPLFLLPLI